MVPCASAPGTISAASGDVMHTEVAAGRRNRQSTRPSKGGLITISDGTVDLTCI